MKADFTNWEREFATCTRAKRDTQNIQNKKIIIFFEMPGEKGLAKSFSKRPTGEETRKSNKRKNAWLESRENLQKETSWDQFAAAGRRERGATALRPCPQLQGQIPGHQLQAAAPSGPAAPVKGGSRSHGAAAKALEGPAPPSAPGRFLPLASSSLRSCVPGAWSSLHVKASRAPPSGLPRLPHHLQSL